MNWRFNIPAVVLAFFAGGAPARAAGLGAQAPR
jgi:hypothetical protein